MEEPTSACSTLAGLMTERMSTAMQLSPRPSKFLQTLLSLTIVTSIVVLTYPVPFAYARNFKPLDPLDETKVRPIAPFVAADAFKIGSVLGGRKLSSVGLNFVANFLGVTELKVPAASIKGWTLQYTMGDGALISALGGETRADLRFLATIHRIMEMGDEGPSHTDGRSNFAYLRSPVDRGLWAVHWFVNDANEWVIGAVQVPHLQLDWRAGSRLFGPSPSASPGHICAIESRAFGSKRWHHESTARINALE